MEGDSDRWWLKNVRIQIINNTKNPAALCDFSEHLCVTKNVKKEGDGIPLTTEHIEYTDKKQQNLSVLFHVFRGS